MVSLEPLVNDCLNHKGTKVPLAALAQRRQLPEVALEHNQQERGAQRRTPPSETHGEVMLESINDESRYAK